VLVRCGSERHLAGDDRIHAGNRQRRGVSRPVEN
jgi:hypothetical protein